MTALVELCERYVERARPLPGAVLAMLRADPRPHRQEASTMRNSVWLRSSDHE